MLEALESAYHPDVVLIDSRAGLHDLAAISVVGLADAVLMFAVDTDQTWQGYRLLFSHWMKRPRVLEAVRDKIVMIHALFPEEEQAANTRKFIEHSHDLFTSTVYENEENAGDAFNFDLMDSDAPHYPRGVDGHGVSRLPRYLSLIAKGEIDPKAEPQLVHDRAATFILDAGHGFGPVACMAGAALAVERAKAAGVCYGLVRRATHTGAIGRYAQWITNATAPPS